MSGMRIWIVVVAALAVPAAVVAGPTAEALAKRHFYAVEEDVSPERAGLVPECPPSARRWPRSW